MAGFVPAIFCAAIHWRPGSDDERSDGGELDRPSVMDASRGPRIRALSGFHVLLDLEN
jgi:hypothetical protein